MQVGKGEIKTEQEMSWQLQLLPPQKVIWFAKKFPCITESQDSAFQKGLVTVSSSSTFCIILESCCISLLFNENNYKRIDKRWYFHHQLFLVTLRILMRRVNQLQVLMMSFPISDRKSYDLAAHFCLIIISDFHVNETNSLDKFPSLGSIVRQSELPTDLTYKRWLFL